MSLRTRLQRLETSRVEAGCPACRDRRGWIVLLTTEQLPDGTVSVVEGQPTPCARCGQISEQIIEIVKRSWKHRPPNGRRDIRLRDNHRVP